MKIKNLKKINFKKLTSLVNTVLQLLIATNVLNPQANSTKIVDLLSNRLKIIRSLLKNPKYLGKDIIEIFEIIISNISLEILNNFLK